MSLSLRAFGSPLALSGDAVRRRSKLSIVVESALKFVCQGRCHSERAQFRLGT